jgi:hypothetical protein
MQNFASDVGFAPRIFAARTRMVGNRSVCATIKMSRTQPGSCVVIQMACSQYVDRLAARLVQRMVRSRDVTARQITSPFLSGAVSNKTGRRLMALKSA